MRSKLEDVSDAQIYFVLKIINNNFDLSDLIFDSDTFTSTDLSEAINKAYSSIGVNIDDEYVEINYIISIVDLNKDVDYSGKYGGQKFNRPSFSIYSYDVDETATERVTRTYRNKAGSYNQDLVIPMIRGAMEDGNLDWYDGDIIDTDTVDTYDTDVELNKNSITKVK